MNLPAGWAAVAGAIASLQLIAAVRLRLGASRRPAAVAAPAPSATVIVPFKGAGAGLDANVSAFLALDYPGALDWVFVTASAQDASLAALRRAAAAEPRVKVVVSAAVPIHAAEQPLNLLAGAAAARGEILVFADSDLGPARDWLSQLVDALQEPGVALASTAMVYRPQGGGLPSWLRLSWMSFGLPWLSAFGWGTGQTLALRRRDFDALDVRGLWERTISNDLPLSARARARGGKVRFLLSAAPDGGETCDWRGLVAHLDRWMTVIRFNAPPLWWCGLAVTAIKLATLWECVQGPFCAPLAAVVLGGELLYGLVVLDALAAADPRRAKLRRAALLFPLLPFLLAVNYAASAFYREIVWSGWTYFFDGPRAELGGAPARRARRVRAARLLAVSFGAAAAGRAYHAGPVGLLAWGAFALLLGAIDGVSWTDALGWGALFGAVECAFAVPWLYVGVRRFIGADPPEAAVWFAGLCLVQGLRWAVVAALAARAPKGWARALAFAAAAVAGESLLPGLLPVPLALTQVFHLPTVQCASLFGDAGPALLVFGFNAAVFLFVRRERGGWPALLLCLFVLGGNECWGRAETARVASAAASAPRLRVAILQAGREPAGPSLPDVVSPKTSLYADLTRRAAKAGPVDLAIWPESSYSARIDYDAARPAAASAGGRPLKELLMSELGAGVPVLLNAVGRGADGDLRNFALLASADGTPLGVSEKEIPAPFGEYLPGGAVGELLRAASPRTGHLVPGHARVLALGPARVGVMICYENVHFAPAPRLAALGANLLVSQDNDAWFDGTDSPAQHLMLDSVRAVETRRAIAHAANTGVSAFVAPTGEIRSTLDVGREGLLSADVPLLNERTNAASGERWLIALCAVVAASTAGLGAKKD